MRTCLILLALAGAPTLAAAQAAPKPPPKPGSTVGEVVVTGQGQQMQTAIDRKSYSVSGDLQAQTGSLADALRNVPAVQVDLQGNVSLRGDPNVTILIDGKPSGMLEGDSKAQSLQSLPANQIERVEVITNPSAEFRADGSGGIINLITKKAKGAGRTGSAKLTAGSRGRVFASGQAGYNSAKLSVTGDVDLRRDSQQQQAVEARERTDPVTGAITATVEAQDLHSTFDLTGAHGALDYDLNDRTRLSFDLRGRYVDFTVGGPSLFTQTGAAGDSTFRRNLDLHQLRANATATATVRRKLGEPGLEATLSLTYDATDDDRVRKGRTTPLAPAGAESFDRQELDYDYKRAQAKGDYVRPMGERSTLKAGFDLQFDDNSYGNAGFQGPSPDALSPVPALFNLFRFEQSLAQAYVTYERPFGDLSVQAGLRVEDVQVDLDQVTQGLREENDYTKLFPSLHVGWKLSETQQLTASYSHRIQRPNPLQFNTNRLLLDPLNIRTGNPRLKPQETHSYEAGYEYRSGPTVYLATLYYRDTFNGISDVVRPVGDGTFVIRPENVAKSRAAGLELVANRKLGPSLSVNLSGNLYWTEIGPQPLGNPNTRSAVSASGRGNLTWQATPKDLVQLNGFLNGRQLTAQGYVEATGGLNLGYRHKIDDRLAFVVTVQDVLHSVRFRQVIDTPTLKSRLRTEFDSRQVQAGFTWTMGGRSREPGFDFQSGAGGGPPS